MTLTKCSVTFLRHRAPSAKSEMSNSFFSGSTIVQLLQTAYIWVATVENSQPKTPSPSPLPATTILSSTLPYHLGHAILRSAESSRKVTVKFNGRSDKVQIRLLCRQTMRTKQVHIRNILCISFDFQKSPSYKYCFDMYYKNHKSPLQLIMKTYEKRYELFLKKIHRSAKGETHYPS